MHKRARPALESTQTTPAQFFAPLESFRGLAALIVVIYHAAWLNPISFSRFFLNGPLMVDFFFVLSGFVMSLSYLQKLRSPQDLGRFLWLRLGRLYPLHVAMLLVFLGIECFKLWAARHHPLVADRSAFTFNNGHTLLTNLLLVHSMGFDRQLSYNYPSWSISTEFYAYVLFAASRVVFQSERMFIAASGVIVAVSLGILLELNIVPLVDVGTQWGYFRCCAGFFLGTLTFQLYKRLRRGSGAHIPAWASVAATGAMIATLAWIDPDGPATYAMPLLSAFLILSVALQPSGVLHELLSCRPLRWLGRVSYSVYMVHAAVLWAISELLLATGRFQRIQFADRHLINTSPFVGLIVLACYVTCVLLVSQLTYQWIEEPFRLLSRRALGQGN
jgi:peptidoglycan/LPS O-acetylase OafA/YrhL